MILLSFHPVGLEIVAHPSSLLVPVNEIGVFTCTARCARVSCSGYWIINNLYTDPEDEFIEKGFTFPPMQQSDSELLMTLRVNASEAVNDSVISCEFDYSGGEGDRNQSKRAKLLVITSINHNKLLFCELNLICVSHAGSPLSRNPVLEKNTTHVTVHWSPPFLWPGQPIEYYNVSLMLESDGSVYSQRVNSTFSDPLVSYTEQMSGESLFCTSFTFYITAVNSSGSSLQTFNVTSCKQCHILIFLVNSCTTTIIIIIASPRIVFPSSAINGTVFYKSDGIPALLEVYLQVCMQSLILELDTFNMIRRIGPSQYQTDRASLHDAERKSICLLCLPCNPSK
jgi:hypothetical protein